MPRRDGRVAITIPPTRRHEYERQAAALGVPLAQWVVMLASYGHDCLTDNQARVLVTEAKTA